MAYGVPNGTSVAKFSREHDLRLSRAKSKRPKLRGNIWKSNCLLNQMKFFPVNCSFRFL